MGLGLGFPVCTTAGSGRTAAAGTPAAGRRPEVVVVIAVVARGRRTQRSRAGGSRTVEEGPVAGSGTGACGL